MRTYSGFQIMSRLLLELKPLLPIIFITISFGVFGFLAAISIATFAAIALGTLIEGPLITTFNTAIIVMVLAAILRGLLRYVEQLSGHYIAFKILYLLRDKLFTKLRTLAPAKLEGKDKGQLISLITSDIELLEVFYAHTIAPIAIAFITNSIIAAILWLIHPLFGALSLLYFVIVGIVLPVYSSHSAKQSGSAYREQFGENNTYILESLRGLKEILLFNSSENKKQQLNEQSKDLDTHLKEIKGHEAQVVALTDFIISTALISFTFIGFYFYATEALSLTETLVSITIIASSFGPVVALSNLSNTLLQTFACAERLFNLLDECPHVDEIAGTSDLALDTIDFDHVTFNYPNSSHNILEDASLTLTKNSRIAIIGESGSGKSTFVKLLMRTYDTLSGTVSINNTDIKAVPTKTLRRIQTLMSQETYLFNGSIRKNLLLAKPDATDDELIIACQKASIHDFISNLPNGYDSFVGELGSMLSSGEKQRIGLARTFLHNGDLLILDEPTSNLDALNEASILQALKSHTNQKSLILISHRQSTTAIANQTYTVKNKKLVSTSK